ncbi:MAG: hypothetical protein Fur0020_04990 [Thermodesulfovibrionia bacterium]
MPIIDINKIKGLPTYAKVIISLIPSVIIIVLFIILIYSPKKKEIQKLTSAISKLDNEIATGEVKARKLDQLKAENELLKTRLAKLQEQLPEEQEVSTLLKEVSELGLKSGLEILLWKPASKNVGAEKLYMEIPVSIEVTTGYHNLGVFFSHISKLPRIVNIKDINLSSSKGGKKGGGNLISAKFTAVTFAGIPPEEKAKLEEEGKTKGKKVKKGG